MKSSKIQLLLRLILLLPVILVNSCVYGLIYTNISTPYCSNLSSTPIGELSSRSSTRQIQIPSSTPGLSAIWNSASIGDAVKGSDIEELHYCDLHTVSILGGIWEKQELIVYGRTLNKNTKGAEIVQQTFHSPRTDHQTP